MIKIQYLHVTTSLVAGVLLQISQFKKLIKSGFYLFLMIKKINPKIQIINKTGPI